MLDAQGAVSLRFPVLEIVDPVDIDKPAEIIGRLGDFEIAIFISANAVYKTIELNHSGCLLPDSLKIAAIGRSTAQALKRSGIRVDLCPHSRFDSEALLELPEMQKDAVNGRRIVIFRGEGGRETLGDILQARGAEVEYAEVYRRQKPNANLGGLINAELSLDIILVTSNEGLQNLYDLAGPSGRQWLIGRQLVVPSERCAQLAKALNFEHDAIIAENASDESMLQAVLQWRKEQSIEPMDNA